MKKFFYAISTVSIFLVSNILYARPDYDGPDSDGWAEIMSTIGSVIKELFSRIF